MLTSKDRYEKVGTEIHSVAVDVPYACLREYVTTRHIQTHLDANAWRALRRCVLRIAQHMTDVQRG